MTPYTYGCSYKLNKLLLRILLLNPTPAWINGSNLKTDFTVFHVNIRSLNKNGNTLYNFLLTLDLSFDVVLTEIWNINLDLCKNLFEGYTFYFDVPADCWWCRSVCS